MNKKSSHSRSMARQFTRNYLIVSIIPLLLLFIFIITGTLLTREYLSNLIRQSTHDLNMDAKQNLQKLGENIIQTKARDVAKQIEIYFRMHPNVDIRAMRKDPLFMELALQKVGKTGYTAMYETRTPIFRVHPNPKLLDRDVSFLAKDLPSWWAIVKATLSGNEVSGYYDWIEPDGSIRKKYMTITPVKVSLNGITMVVAATTYIDEFSDPIVDMERKADQVVNRYQSYVASQWLIFGLAVAILIVLTFFGTYFLGRRETLRYILPIMQLADTARKFGEGKWDVELHDHVLQRQDEIGIMAQSFNGMSLQLKDLFNSLEQRVTELKQAQDALKKSEDHYRSLFDGVPVGIYRTSPDGKIIDANPMLVQMLGYPDRDTFLSISAQDLYVDPNDRAIWQSRMKEDNIIHSYEIRMRKYDGTGIWIENHSRAVKDEYGKVLYYEGSLKDTTESKRAQAALKKSEESFKSLYEESQRAQEVYRSLIHSSADAIVIYDLEVKVTYVSPMFTQIFGWSSEELTGKQIPFLPESEKQSSEAEIKDVIENGTPCHNFETKRTTRDGRLIDVSISASRYDDHKGNPAGILVIFRDISERKRLEAHLQHMERMEAIGTLAGGVAHDFNNLLMVIRGSVSLMLHGMKPSHPHYKHCINIETQSQRGSKLASHLLGYARKGKYEVKPLNLNEIILESMETYRRTRKDINIHYDLSPDIYPVEVDIYQIEQVLMNLYINAFDAMMDGGDLLLITKNVSSREMDKSIYDAKQGNYIMLMVKDTGIGMDQKTMDRIFEPFFTTKEVDKGTGLGLASVYGIVQGHGGYISVASEIGQGATFSLYFPASEKIIEAVPSKTKKAFISKGTILLIDDEKMVLDVGASMLSTLGYTVIKAISSQKGIEIYQQQQHRIDLVILDMIMPDISGSQAFDLLREINPHVAILLSSGYSIEGKAMEIMDRGCNGFIQKPYNLEDLSEKIKKIMSARSI